MPQPRDVDRAAEELIDLFTAAQADLERQLVAALINPAGARRAARLRELLRSVNATLDQLDTDAHAWLTTRFPDVYALGAETAAASIGEEFFWTQPHLDAVQALAERTFADLLEATRFVRRDVKAWIRDEARQQTTLALLEGRTAKQAGAALADAAGGDLGLLTVTYKNGAQVRIADYAEMLLRTESAKAYSTGTTNQARAMGVTAMECADGDACGLDGHDDDEKPNGKVYPLEVAEEFPISHPNCRRSWIPRIDVNNDQIDTATSIRDPASIADQRASEQLAASGRAPRTPRGD